MYGRVLRGWVRQDRRDLVRVHFEKEPARFDEKGFEFCDFHVYFLIFELPQKAQKERGRDQSLRFGWCVNKGIRASKIKWVMSGQQSAKIVWIAA